MHITQLTVTNFKSFKETHTLEFSKHVNIFLGINGSGKSNLIDCFSFLFNATSQNPSTYISDYSPLNPGKCTVDIHLTENNRFPFQQSFNLTATLDKFKKQYETPNNKAMSPSSMQELLESVNLQSTINKFIIKQGMITQISLMDDSMRYNLIKNIAGADHFEKSNAECTVYLNDCLQIENKIVNLLKNVQGKLDNLEKEIEITNMVSCLENEKRGCELLIYEKEIEQVNNQLANCEEVIIENNNEVDDEIELENCKRMIKEFKTVEFKDYEIKEETNLEKLGIEIDNLNTQTNKLNNKLKHLKEKETNTKIEYEALRMDQEAHKIFVNKENVDIEHEKKEIEDLLIEKRNTLALINTQEDAKKHPQINLQELIIQRNKLWVEERNLISQINQQASEHSVLEKRILYNMGLNSDILAIIKSVKGVHGFVYELIKPAKEIMGILNIVANKMMYNLVVEDENTATEILKIVKGRITIIPLNKFKYNPQKINEKDAIPLKSQIKAREIYGDVINYITQNTFIVPNIKTGLLISKTHNINAITMEGDYISKKGTMSTNTEKKTNYINDLKDINKNIKKMHERKTEIQNTLKQIQINIKEATTTNLRNGNEEYKNTLKSIIMYMERRLTLYNMTDKINIKKYSGQIKILIDNTEKKLENYAGEITMVSKDIKEITNNIDRQNTKYSKMNEIMHKREQKEKYTYLKNKINELENKLQNDQINSKKYMQDDNEENKRIKRKVLLEKKNTLKNKIGTLHPDKEIMEKYKGLNENELYEKIKKINSYIKKHPIINRRAAQQQEITYKQKEKLNERMKTLMENKKQHNEFIKEIENKKEETINVTLKMVQDNFTTIFKKLSPNNKAILKRSNNGIELIFNDQPSNELNKLSGGQKTLLALALIFSIQKIDPSPFYFFDEIDANLDEQGREKVMKLIKEISYNLPHTQFFIATFRKEMLNCGHKYFKVQYRNKTSNVEEITKEEALEFITHDSQL